MDTFKGLRSQQFSEIELISLIVSGQKRLFEYVMRGYNRRLYRIGMSILHRDVDVEDMMQNTYLKAYEHLNEFEQKSLLGTWLTRIMINECLLQKKRNRRFDIESAESYSGSRTDMQTPENILVSKELGLQLEDAISRLPEQYRLVFVLREIENLSVKETGEALSIGVLNGTAET
ncbi:sigma-70 family RNA polymerase sigma factor [Pedobacter hiemivivus]|uniref:Sigma-70 family RNA polymerase sigma factor n=1 Tax=Pedobacter hiemivivus TaxID=2530454 RepID=A0A4U1GF93_9SPHI|nr:sigma-70 family RNA polymerase sigma factor [Pedobacter hiemivivus]TKC59962.1 sigma-70 family RNA polymerase sigma factor [Pedobacter hiemivivus]